MEQMNKIELRGIVGTTKTTNGVVRFTLATSYTFKDKEGCVVIDTTWHNVICYGGIELKKGDKVEVEGRLRNTRFTDAYGDEHYSTEILANNVKILDSEEKLELETKKKKHCVFDVYFSPIISVECDVDDENNLTTDDEVEILQLALDKMKTINNDELLCQNFEKIELYEVEGNVLK